FAPVVICHVATLIAMAGCPSASRMNRARDHKFLFATAALVFMGNASAQSIKLDGHWQGPMEREGAVMTVRFDFETGPAGVTGRFTSESQRAIEYPLDEVDYSGSTIHWVLGGSLIFDGNVSPQAIAGTFHEGPGRGTFSLKPVALDPMPYGR